MEYKRRCHSTDRNEAESGTSAEILSIKFLNGFRPFFLLLLPLLCKAFGYNEILKWWIVRICMGIVLKLSIAGHVILKSHKLRVDSWSDKFAICSDLVEFCHHTEKIIIY